MQFTTRVMRGYLRAELHGRETVEETQEFISAVADAARKAEVTAVLVVVRNSRPIFKVDQYRISDHLKFLGANPDACIALVGDNDALRASHEYIEVLARQQGANVRSFRDEASAAEWLKAAQSQENR